MVVEVYLKGGYIGYVEVPDEASQKEIGLILYDMYGDDWDYYLLT